MEVTHKDGSPRRGEQRIREDNPILNYRRALLKGTTPNESIKVNFTEGEDALSNSVILRHIFTFLDYEDLESCCHVCKDWRTVADSLVVTHFGVKLAETHGEIHGSNVSPQLLANYKHFIIVHERARYNRKSFTRRNDFGVTQILEAILTQKVSISLKLYDGVDIRDEKIMDFFSKIGPRVVDLDLSKIDYLRMNAAGFCKLLLQKFPNLKKLNCCRFRQPFPEKNDFLEDHLFDFLLNDEHYDNVNLEDQLFDTDLPHNKHKRLREIVFGYEHFTKFTYSFVETVLKICPNLEKIEDFPLEFINAVVVAEKGPALKSLLSNRYADRDFQKAGETVVTACEKLARLQPKLTSLVLTSGRFDSETQFELVKPFLFCLLKSCEESLELLQIAPLRFKELQRIPALKGLKELDLLLQYRDDDGVFFTPEMPVKEIFPNVSKFDFSNQRLTEVFIERHLPENLICPWGSQIIEMSVNDLAVSAIPLLQRRFPSIQKLELKNTEDDLAKILLELSRFWTQLKYLAISCGSLDYDRMLEKNWMDRNYRIRLDHAFTGLPFKVLDQLEDPYFNHFTYKKTQEFKDRSVISKLKALRGLKIFLREYNEDFLEDDGTYGIAYTRLTSIADEFGFSLLPKLRVTLAVEPLVHFAKNMKRDLARLATCSNIKIVNAVDGYPYVF